MFLKIKNITYIACNFKLEEYLPMQNINRKINTKLKIKKTLNDISSNINMKSKK